MIKIKIQKPVQFTVFVLAILVILFSISLLIWRYFSWETTLNASGQFDIVAGNGAKEVWQGLVKQGFTGSVWPWRYYAWRMDASSKLKPGTYSLEAGETLREAIRQFIAGFSQELTITFPEGFTLKQMAVRTAQAGIGTEQDFIKVAEPANYSSQFAWLKEIPAGRDLEGYFFPDTYRFFVDDEPADVARRMLSNFDEKFSEGLRDEAEAAGRTVDQIITMASIIEREVISDEDMALAAGVLWKRFDDGAGLDADATVRYALSKWEGALTAEDLESQSPYNTRKWRGLPPGPISNPGLRAIMAAVRPEQSDYYYYLSAPDGRTIFSKTLEEHNVNKVKYLK